jgi:hypothetical protein
MSDKRPAELSSYIEEIAPKNDTLIVNALADLENPKTRGKRKPTVQTISKITGLSPNTIRNRDWARKRLKAIKQSLKADLEGKYTEVQNEDSEGAILDRLRGRIKLLLDQNALLYEEILSLRRIIDGKDAELKKK